jgi:hypothetical protein
MEMLYGLIYDTTTGQPLQYMSASAESLLLIQVPPAGQGLLPLEEAPAPETFTRMVLVAGELVEKTAAVITASPNPFIADGVSECAVTLTPFVPCTLRVGGVAYSLTTEDPVLVLTSESAATFRIVMEWLPTHWADPIVVSAEDE